MSEIPWDIIIPNIGWIAVFVTVLVAVATLFYRFGGWNERIKKIETAINLLLAVHKGEIMDFYMKSWGSVHKSNPSTEKDILMRKLRDGTITRDENLRLREILEEERRQAQAVGAILAVLAIGGLLLLLAVLSGED